MKALSLFDGAGGLYMALKKLGVVPTLYVSSEIDKHARAVTRARIPDFIEAGDIRNLKIKDGMLLRGTWDEEAQDVVGPYTFICTGDFDIITAGSPCQGFSLSGHQKGFDDPRSKLFWHFVRLIREGSPDYWMLENTKMKTTYRDTITSTLGVEPKRINSSAFTAQNRVRDYWANFPIKPTQSLGPSLCDILEDSVADRYIYGTIRDLVDKGKIVLSPNVYGKEGVLPAAIRGRYFEGKTRQQLEIRDGVKSNCLTTVAKDSLIYVGGLQHMRRLDDGKDFSRNFREGGRVYSAKGEASTLTASSKGGAGGPTGLYLDGGVVRRLTPVECERLQGWPDGWASGIVSPTQTHKLTGNGWNVPTIAHILKTIV